MAELADLNEKERAALLKILDYERSTDPARDWPLGWSWSAVRTHPSVLNSLVLKGILEERFHSRSYRGLALTESVREEAEALLSIVEPTSERTVPSRLELPDDLFDPIEGHTGIKSIVTKALQSEKPVHVLCTGVPSSAKTMFLLELARLGAPYILGSQSTKAGIMSPRILGLDIFLIVMVMLVIGGLGKFPGAMIGAFIVTFLSEFSRPLEVYRLIMFGAIVVTSVVLMPEGIMKAVDLVSPSVARFFGKKDSAI